MCIACVLRNLNFYEPNSTSLHITHQNLTRLIDSNLANNLAQFPLIAYTLVSQRLIVESQWIIDVGAYRRLGLYLSPNSTRMVETLCLGSTVEVSSTDNPVEHYEL